MDFRMISVRYRRAILIFVAAVLIYTLAGFLLLPWFLQRYLTHSLAENLQRKIEVSDVQFNPYLIKLQVEGFRLLDIDNTPLASLDRLMLDYQFTSVFRMGFGVENFLLENPYLKLEADGKGGFTILNLVPQSSSAGVEKDSASSGDEIPKFWLEKFLISGGVIDYRDADRAGGFQQVIKLPNLAVKDFYTLSSSHANSLAVEIHDHESGVMRLETSLSLQPVRLKGDLDIKNLNLGRAWQWLMLPTNYHLQAPHLDLSTQFEIQVKDKFSLQTTNGSISLRDTVLSDKASPEVPVIKIPVLSIADMQFNLEEQSVTMGSVQAVDGLLDVLLDKQGVANLQTLFAPVEKPAGEPVVDPAAQAVVIEAAVASPPVQAAAQSDKPWNVLINQLLVSNFTVNFRDEKPKEPFAISLLPLSIAISEFRPLSSEKFSIQMKTGIASASIQQTGTLALDANIQPAPLSADVRVDLQQFPLKAVQPYVADFVKANIVTGVTGAQMEVHFEGVSPPKVLVKGAAKVDKLGVHQAGESKEILTWDALSIEGILFQLPENNLKIAKITLDKPGSGFVINPDGTTNVQKLLVPQPAAPKKDSSAPMKMNIETIAINNADLGFADLTMKPNFKVAMHQLSGTIKGLSSNPKTQAEINLKGKVDRYAPVTIRGRLNPLIPNPSLDAHMAFSNLELTTFTPYSGTYAGFKIEQGQLSLDIDYKLVNNKIQGKNKIVIDQLQLGAPVESNKAVDLPLRLAIALLKDENGVIDLGFEVGGDLNDPQFSIGGIIWKVFSNMIMKVVTSPFNAMSSLMGGENTEGIDQIIFEPGKDVLDTASQKKLQTAAAMLAKRASIYVNVQGNVLPDEDRPGIQSQKLIATVNEKGQIPIDAFSSAQAAVQNEEAYDALESYFDKHQKEDLDDLYDRIADEMKARGEKPEKQAVQVKTYEQGWQILQKQISVSDEELDDLAMRRAKQIKANLVEVNHVAPERVFVLDANPDPAKASLTTSLILNAK